MGRFLYFVPGCAGAGKNDLDGLGLQSRLGDVEFEQSEAARGPSGTSGVVLARSREEKDENRIGIYPDRQRWQKESDTLWVGVENDALPEPDDLLRSTDMLVDGHVVDLRKGGKWLVPVARIFPQGTMLPEALVIGPDGGVVTETIPEFARLCSVAEDRVFPAICQEAGIEDVAPEDFDPMDRDEAFSVAADALAVNYRVGIIELSLLKILTTQNIGLILQAFVDFPSIIAIGKSLSKKNGTGDGDNTDDGETDC